jgi:hypothetical protein
MTRSHLVYIITKYSTFTADLTNISAKGYKINYVKKQLQQAGNSLACYKQGSREDNDELDIKTHLKSL